MSSTPARHNFGLQSGNTSSKNSNHNQAQQPNATKQPSTGIQKPSSTGLKAPQKLNKAKSTMVEDGSSPNPQSKLPQKTQQASKPTASQSLFTKKAQSYQPAQNEDLNN